MEKKRVPVASVVAQEKIWLGPPLFSCAEQPETRGYMTHRRLCPRATLGLYNNGHDHRLTVGEVAAHSCSVAGIRGISRLVFLAVPQPSDLPSYFKRWDWLGLVRLREHDDLFCFHIIKSGKGGKISLSLYWLALTSRGGVSGRRSPGNAGCSPTTAGRAAYRLEPAGSGRGWIPRVVGLTTVDIMLQYDSNITCIVLERKTEPNKKRC